MRVFDIITENKKIDEAPAGALSQMGRRLGAKALGAIGFKGKAAELTGKADVGAEANKLKTDLRGYLGKTGGNPKQIQGPQLAAFLKSKGYPNMHLKGVQGVMTPQQVDQAVLKAAQDAAAADGDPAVGASSAPQATPPAKAAGAASKSATAGQTPAQTPGAPSGVPPALLKKLTQLSSQDKKQLLGML
jgi:hypothetical protein